MGLSGSGKSTVVRCLSRLVEPTAGEIMLDGSDLLKASDQELIEIRRHKMGMVFQKLRPAASSQRHRQHRLPLKLQGIDLAERRKRAERVIELVGLQGRETSYPAAACRAASSSASASPGLSPSSRSCGSWTSPSRALDPLIRRQMQDEFLRIQQVLHKIDRVHHPRFSRSAAHRRPHGDHADGAVVQIGTPAELIVNPADDYVAEFTSDVPLARVLTRRRSGQQGDQGTRSMPRVKGDVSRGIASAATCEPQGGVAVEDAREIFGVATAQDVIAALALESSKRLEDRGAGVMNGRLTAARSDLVCLHSSLPVPRVARHAAWLITYPASWMVPLTPN